MGNATEAPAEPAVASAPAGQMRTVASGSGGAPRLSRAAYVAGTGPQGRSDRCRRALVSSTLRARWVARRAARHRKLKLDFQAWTIVPHFNVSPMQLSDGSNKTETEAIAGADSAALDPVESLEDVLALLEGNARPTISDRDRGTVGVVPHRDLDIADPAVLYGIVDEVGDRVEQEIPVAKDGHPPAALEVHATALLFGRGGEQLCDLAAHLV